MEQTQTILYNSRIILKASPPRHAVVTPLPSVRTPNLRGVVWVLLRLLLAAPAATLSTHSQHRPPHAAPLHTDYPPEHDEACQRIVLGLPILHLDHPVVRGALLVLAKTLYTRSPPFAHPMTQRVL